MGRGPVPEPLAWRSQQLLGSHGVLLDQGLAEPCLEPLVVAKVLLLLLQLAAHRGRPEAIEGDAHVEHARCGQQPAQEEGALEALLALAYTWLGLGLG